jgi:hypothetical protein
VPEFGLQLSEAADELVSFEVGGLPGTVVEYAVVLRHLDADGRATAVRVFDNFARARRAPSASLRFRRQTAPVARDLSSRRAV